MTLSMLALWACLSLLSPISSVAAGENICGSIRKSVDSAHSLVSYPGSPEYDEDVRHYMSSSSQVAECSVRPATAADVGVVLRLVGKTRTPFAVKGGGHSLNQGFSSTTGVHISTHNFKDIVYDDKGQTVIVGAGLTWGEVYVALEPHGVNVVGGRIMSVGVAGLTLGGGYSWKTNQFGLTVDTVVAYELVLPSGGVQKVTESSNKDLFFALRGGGNNFGIVTKFTLKTYPQGQVWGGPMIIAGPSIDLIAEAISNFQANVTDPKASMLCTYGHSPGFPFATIGLFYDGPTPPAGAFDEFVAIPAESSDLKTRSFVDLVLATKSEQLANKRGVFNTVSHTDITASLANFISNEALFRGDALTNNSLFFLGYTIEPFLPSAYTSGTTPTSFPPSRAQAFLPMCVMYIWTDEAHDETMFDAVKASTAAIEATIAPDLVEDSSYPNYSAGWLDARLIYGAGLERLRGIRGRVDPKGVMGLAGGFKI